jgi:succinate-semialdehyde dehydrogenase/glutarate-semialdehyde dehydrogenase
VIETMAVFDPATGAVVGSVPDATAADALTAVDTAAAAQREWAAVPARARADILMRALDGLTARADQVALLITQETGKPLSEAHGEVSYSAAYLRWFAEEAVRIRGSYARSPDGQGRNAVLRQPVGPCLLITPWNFPLAMAARKIAPALAAGCTAVVKPAEQTPLATLALADVLADAGLPRGVLHVVTTSDPEAVATAALAHPALRKLSFTGSTAVGRTLLRQAGDRVLRTSMELGGNAPFIVFEDADLDAAIEGALFAKLRNAGQACTAANRMLVAAKVHDQFAERLALRMDALRLGPGTDPDTDIGPLIDQHARSRVASVVDQACAAGAHPLTAATTTPAAGSFYPPTVLVGVPPDARVVRDEVFGPVAPVLAFACEDEAVAVANGTDMGLAAYVYTRDGGRALRVGEALEAGMVAINRGSVSQPAAPFGGIKQSGVGREGGGEGIDEYLEAKYLAIGD